MQQPGIFTDGCYYGENESQSDHAPVLYGEFGTWNVAAPISHFSIQPDPKKPTVFFFNHKFFTDAAGNLVNRQGGKVGFLGGSEVALLTKVTQPEDIRKQIYKQIDNQSVKNTEALDKKLAVAYKKLSDQIINELADSPEKDAKIAALMQLHSLAKEEINNDSEEKYKATIELLRNFERSYAAVTNHYINRMEKIAEKIKEMFRNNPDLNYMALQEVPEKDDVTIAQENLQSLIKEAFSSQDPWVDAIKRILASANLENQKLHINYEKLTSILNEAPQRVLNRDIKRMANTLAALRKRELLGDNQASQRIEFLLNSQGSDNLSIDFYEPTSRIMRTEIAKTNFKKNMIPDVAIVSRKSAPQVKQEIADHDSRFVPCCSDETKSCYISVHMPFTASSNELITRCKDIKTLARVLSNKGYNKIKFAGDFNTNASRIAAICGNNLVFSGAKVVLHTSKNEAGNSCGSNQGHKGQKNIDILIDYEITKKVSN